jgi:hypothetical protein
MIVFILLSITINKNEILPYATAFKTEAKCLEAKAKIDKEFNTKYGNSTVVCTKQKVRE